MGGRSSSGAASLPGDPQTVHLWARGGQARMATCTVATQPGAEISPLGPAQQQVKAGRTRRAAAWRGGREVARGEVGQRRQRGSGTLAAGSAVGIMLTSTLLHIQNHTLIEREGTLSPSISALASAASVNSWWLRDRPWSSSGHGLRRRLCIAVRKDARCARARLLLRSGTPPSRALCLFAQLLLEAAAARAHTPPAARAPPPPRARARRSGLNARSQPSDQLQINIDPGFNYDSQLQSLRNDVKKIKQARLGAVRGRARECALVCVVGPNVCAQTKPPARRISTAGCLRGERCCLAAAPVADPRATARRARPQLAYAIDDERKLQGAEISTLVGGGERVGNPLRADSFVRSRWLAAAVPPGNRRPRPGRRHAAPGLPSPAEPRRPARPLDAAPQHRPPFQK
jgi:hypothetical protein